MTEELARERRLAEYRRMLHLAGRLDPGLEPAPSEAPWTEADLRGFDWISALAASGHVGAQRLRQRALGLEQALDALAARDPAQVKALLGSCPLAGFALARLELARPAADLDAVCRWLLVKDVAGRPGEIVVAAIGELQEAAGMASACDLAVLRRVLEARNRGRMRLGDALHELARARLASGDAAGHAGGERLLARAARLGSDEARDEMLRRNPDPAQICDWLDAERAPAVGAVIVALRSLGAAIGPEELLILRNACYLGLAAGPGAVPEHGREPYRARLFYTLARLKLGAALEPERAAGERLLECAAELGSRRAQLECYQRERDPQALASRLGAGGQGEAAAAVRELAAIAGAPAEADLEILGDSIHQKEESTAGLLYAFARHRAGGRQLLERAAQLGSLPAKSDLVGAAFDAAADKHAFVHRFIEQYPRAQPIAEQLFLRLGMALEREGALAEALGWYARALGREVPPGGERDRDFCYAVATAFDRRWRVHRLDVPAQALAWHERGIAAGEVRCLEGWIDACVADAMGIAGDPQAALERVQRYLASGEGTEGTRCRNVRRSLIERARRHLPEPAGSDQAFEGEEEAETWNWIKDRRKPEQLARFLRVFAASAHAVEARRRLAELGYFIDPGLASRWLRVAVLLGSPSAAAKLGVLALLGLGSEPDPRAARGWLEQAAALGSGFGRAARTAEGSRLLGLDPGPGALEESDADGKLALAAIALYAGERGRAQALLRELGGGLAVERRMRAVQLGETGRCGPAELLDVA